MVYVPAGTVRPDLTGKPLEAALAQCKIDTEKFPRTREQRCVAEAFSSESGQPITVDAFFIDHLEVAQEHYAKCVRKGRCKTLKLTWELKTQPATGVTWQMAEDYCAFRGGRLPTADEWLRAARGDDDRLYPWGSEPPVVDGAHKANYGRLERRGPRPSRADGHKYAAPVGVFADRGRSALHVANLGGNVREWTATKQEQGAIVAGGGWRDIAVDLRTTRREVIRLDQVANDLGFRCVVDVADP
jgi:formylglycine-generating enzyme required for sulfatase activity